MMFDIPKAVESVSGALKGIFDFASTVKCEQINTEVLNDKHDVEEANRDALRALKIADKYTESMTIKDRFLFRHFYSSFLKEK